MCPPKGIRCPPSSFIHVIAILKSPMESHGLPFCFFKKSTMSVVVFVAICLDLQCTETCFIL